MGPELSDFCSLCVMQVRILREMYMPTVTSVIPEMPQYLSFLGNGI